MFVAGEIVLVTAGPLKDCKVLLKESSSRFALLVEGCIPEYLVTGDFVVFAVNKETGGLYSQESWGAFSGSVIAKVDHLKDAFFEENKDVVKMLKRVKEVDFLGHPSKLNVLNDLLTFIGYHDKPDRERIIKEFL